MAELIVVDFDCDKGCNNPEFNPDCDESNIRIKIDANASLEFNLFQKYMKIPCPRCGKLGEQKRSGWWGAKDENTGLYDYDKSHFYPRDVMDYTDQMIEAKAEELKCDRKSLKSDLSELTGKISSCEVEAATRKRRKAREDQNNV